MRTLQNRWGYILLATIWIAVAIWQFVEHRRVEDLYKDGMIEQSRVISTSVARVIRSQGIFGLVQRRWLEAALEELARSEEIRAVGLAQLSGEMIITAGEPYDFNLDELESGPERWSEDTLTVVNVIELGPRIESFGTSDTFQLAEFSRPDRDNRRDGPNPPREFQSNRDDGESSPGLREDAMDRPPGAPGPPPEGRGMDREEFRGDGEFGSGRDRRGDGRGGRAFRGFPRWMSEEEIANILRLEGPYYLSLALPIDPLKANIARDLWLRLGLVGLALVAVVGVGAALASAGRYFDLEVRLARAQEMNTALREMNLAAAGLAHETRNPLNLVRTMAQIIARESPADSEVGVKSKGIVEEVDRVASRLNEFIDYSKPREAKLAHVDLKAVIRDVGSALESDLEDKGISFQVTGPDISIEADESLLRQALFNLALNALQAAPQGGKVEIAVVCPLPREAWMEVRDNGPGVPPESRHEIFQPYFTTRADGTGLGLAVVRQIVLAHHWDIECVSNEEGLTVFRVKKMHVL